MRCVPLWSDQLSSRMSGLSLSAGSMRGIERAMDRASSSSSLGHSASVGTNTAVMAKECSSQTSVSARPFMHMGMHQAPQSPYNGIQQLPGSYEMVPMEMDTVNVARNGKALTGRYNSSFGYETDGAYCLVSG